MELSGVAVQDVDAGAPGRRCPLSGLSGTAAETAPTAACLSVYHEAITDLSEACQRELDALDLLAPRLDEPQPELALGPTESRPQVSFSESVRRAVDHFKDEEFTVTNVESVLKAQGIPLPARNVRTRISIEVKDLLRKGRIKLIRSGSGNTPHVYRRVLLIPPRRVVPEKSEGASRAPSDTNLQH